MGYTDDEFKKEVKNTGVNYVYYVSDMEEVPSSGHFRKMDAGREISQHICRGVNNCILRKYTEYYGEKIQADSVGIVFPAHMWGISLAVYSFIMHLLVAKGTYVYAVAVGENLSGCVDATVTNRLNSLSQFKRIFTNRGLGNDEDIFIRCIDVNRDYSTTEECIRKETNNKNNFRHILSGLLFYSVDSLSSLMNKESIKKDNDIMRKVSGIQEEKDFRMIMTTPTETSSKSVHNDSKIKLNNIFLDESLFAGVKICRVM